MLGEGGGWVGDTNPILQPKFFPNPVSQLPNPSPTRRILKNPTVTWLYIIALFFSHLHFFKFNSWFSPVTSPKF